MWLVYLKLVLTMAIWGGTFIAGRTVSQSMSPFSASFCRFAVASLCLLFLVRHQSARLPKLKFQQIPLIILLGLSGVFAYNVFFFLGLQTISASRAGLIIALNPVAIALGSKLFFGEKLTPLKIFGIATSLMGVALIITEGNLATLLANGIGTGELFILGCVGSWGVYSLAGKQAMKTLSSLAATTYAIWIGSIALLPLAIWEQSQELSSTNYLTWVSLLYLGILGTVIAFNWYYEGIQTMGAAKASIFINLVPIFAVIFGVIFLQETVDSILLVGGIFVVVGVSLVNYKHRIILSR